MKIEKIRVKTKVLILLSLLSFSACSTANVSSSVPNVPSSDRASGSPSASAGTSQDSAIATNNSLAPQPTGTPSNYSYPMATTAPSTQPSAQTGLTPDLGSGANNQPKSTIAVQPALEETKNKDNVFKDYGTNPFISTNEDKLSTFAIDVDTASYTWMRKAILNNLIPDKNSVRAEEYINYFDYNYPQPEQNNQISISTELTKLKNSNILRVGLQAKKIDNEQRKNAHLTLVIDISGSMDIENRLALVKQSAKILVNSLTDKDYISIVVFGSSARSVTEYSNDKEQLIKAIDSLNSEGATNTEAGLNLGYKIAKQNYKAGYINKVILCSDGFANIGAVGPDALLKNIRQDALSGISLSTIGFGMGNYNDVLMEQLADKGDGSYAYVDDINEANRIFTQNLTSTLQTVAKDTKVQVDFNSQVVSEYRLIGYENRDVADKDFRNDQVDAGEVGANQKVTALYEIKIKDNAKASDELCNVYLRYKDLDQNQLVKELNKSVKLEQLKNFELTDSATKTSIAAAIYAEKLKGSYWSQIFSFDDVIQYAQKANQTNENEKLREFISLVNKTKSLK